jgi:hypothetical protein
LPDGPYGTGWVADDGHEDMVDSQIAALEELTGKELSQDEGDDLATKARDYRDMDGEPDAIAAWEATHGEIKDPSTPLGRQQRMAAIMESEERKAAEDDAKVGYSEGEDPKAIRHWPKFETSRQLHPHAPRRKRARVVGRTRRA